MQTLMRPQSPDPYVRNRESLRARKKRRFSPVMFTGTIITLLLVLGAGTFLVLQQKSSSRAADAEINCTLIVPPQPLSAQGLATPYQLTATGDDDQNCREANKMQAAFVQGAIFDPATNQISAYNPLVTDKGKKPAIDPVVPKLPQGAVVALWFGFNGTNLTLKSNDNSLQDGKCVDGLKKSLFTQFSYCNAPAFFAAANQAIKAGKLTPSALGMGKDNLICPTVRDFGVVDQDQSDNVTTAYLINRKGRTAQMTAANVTQLNNSDKTQVNGSDNRLLAVALDGALGCKPWMVADLADPGHTTTSLPLDELQAAAHQAQPVAVVPAGDPMTKVGDDKNLRKLNLYRVGVDQPTVQNLDDASTKAYCKSLLAVGPERILVDAKFTRNQPSPDRAAANNLFTFLAQRFNATFGDGGLNCQGLLDTNSPIKVKNNDNNVAISATIFGMQSIDTSNCVANGKLVQDCQGKTQIDDQTCSFKLHSGDTSADLNCPNDHSGNNGDNGNNHSKKHNGKSKNNN